MSAPDRWVSVVSFIRSCNDCGQEIVRERKTYIMKQWKLDKRVSIFPLEDVLVSFSSSNSENRWALGIFVSWVGSTIAVSKEHSFIRHETTFLRNVPLTTAFRFPVSTVCYCIHDYVLNCFIHNPVFFFNFLHVIASSGQSSCVIASKPFCVISAQSAKEIGQIFLTEIFLLVDSIPFPQDLNLTK